MVQTQDMPVQSNSGSSATICTQCLDNAFCVKFQNCKTAKSIPGSRFLGLKLLKLVTNPPESPSQLRQTTNDPAILHYLMQTTHAPRPARFPPRNPTKSAQRWTKRWTPKEVGHHTTKSAQWWTKRWAKSHPQHQLLRFLSLKTFQQRSANRANKLPNAPTCLGGGYQTSCVHEYI